MVIQYSDKFSSPENIGLLVIKYQDKTEATIDLFLLSCRVLGRGIEAAIPNIAAKVVAARGVKVLKAEMIETERNTPARSVYKEAGYSEINSGTSWELETKKHVVPKWIKYQIKRDIPK